MKTSIAVLIADDEPLLREHRREKLAALWSELSIVGEAANGNEAAELIAKLKPDIAFLDIKMPGQIGIEVAQGIETDTRVVFVTAFDQYAVDAFNSEAVDYVLKPVADARLAQTVTRLRKSLAEQTPAPDIAQLLTLLTRSRDGEGGSLRWIRANRGETTFQIAVDEVMFFQSDDKYTVVQTANGEHLIGKPLAELVRTLDSAHFWQIHRGTVVNVHFIASTRRDGDSRMTVSLKNYAKPLVVSRAYQHPFKHMKLGTRALTRSQRIEQRGQTVVIDLAHQLQQSPQFAFRKSLARKPVQVVAGQVGEQVALVFAEGHFPGDKLLQVFGIHGCAFFTVRVSPPVRIPPVPVPPVP